MAEDLGVADDKNTWLDQSFHIYSGILSGVSARLFWAPDKPHELIVDAGPFSRIEDHAMSVLIGAPAVLASVVGFLFLRWPILGGIVGALLGGVLGVGLYAVTADPIFNLILRGKRAQSAETVREVHAILCERATPSESDAQAAC